MVFAGDNLIAENGKILRSGTLFENKALFAEIDVGFIAYERSCLFNHGYRAAEGYRYIDFSCDDSVTVLTREYPKTPFVPADKAELSSRAELILTMQAAGLKKRIEHVRAKTVVIGLSGGLDSTLALLVAARAMKSLGREPKDILGHHDALFRHHVPHVQQYGKTGARAQDHAEKDRYRKSRYAASEGYFAPARSLRRGVRKRAGA